MSLFSKMETAICILRHNFLYPKYEVDMCGAVKLFCECSFDYMCAVLSLSVMSDSANPWTIDRLAPLSMGILQARIQEWIAMPSYRGSSQPRD